MINSSALFFSLSFSFSLIIFFSNIQVSILQIYNIKMYNQIPLTALFAVLATASPTWNLHLKPYLSTRAEVTAREAAAAEITTDQLLAISPNSSTCDNPPAEGECATAEQAAPFISDSFSTYAIDNVAEQAALISLMAFESGDFKYNRNHFPGVAGQGSTSSFPPSNRKSTCIRLTLGKKRETCNPQPSTTNMPPQSLS
jgi:hypothetical protein